MKVSKFTSMHTYNGETILFNSENEKFLLLSPELEKIYHDHTLSPNELQCVHLDFFNALKADRFIVPCTENEADALIRRWEKGRTRQTLWRRAYGC